MSRGFQPHLFLSSLRRGDKRGFSKASPMNTVSGFYRLKHLCLCNGVYMYSDILWLNVWRGFSFSKCTVLNSFKKKSHVCFCFFKKKPWQSNIFQGTERWPCPYVQPCLRSWRKMTHSSIRSTGTQGPGSVNLFWFIPAFRLYLTLP